MEKYLEGLEANERALLLDVIEGIRQHGFESARVATRQIEGKLWEIKASRHRVFYVTTWAEAIYVLHAFEKKTRKTAARDLEIGRDRFRALGKLRQQHGKEERN